MKRGSSIAVCGSIPKTAIFRRTCRMACTWLSPPGDPMGIVILLSRNTITGFGVSRGRLPGATEEGCRGSAHDWEPREEGAKPVPGMTMVSLDTSLGLMEIALPQKS